MPERCRFCGESYPFGDTVHLLVHTQSEAGVLDFYVCRGCYESEIADKFEDIAESSP